MGQGVGSRGAALGAGKQEGKEEIEDGTPILWHASTVREGCAILHHCPGCWKTLNRYWGKA